MKLYCLLLSIFCVSFAFAQKEKSNVSIHLIANDKIADVNIDQEKFLSYFKKISEVCEAKLKDIPTTQKVGILFIAHKTGGPTFEFYGTPKLDKTIVADLLKNLYDIKPENTKIVDFPIFLAYNAKSDKIMEEFVDFISPLDKKVNEYVNADLKTKVQLNKDYVINEALPVLSAYQVVVDEKFEGVKKFGKLVSSTSFSHSQNIESLTSNNNDYWRAVAEMNAGNQLIPVTKIAMLLSQGEFDYARKYYEILSVFSDSKSTADSYLEEMKARLDLFFKDLEEMVNKGIVLHDKGKYDDAIKVYEGILAEYPNSAWALYEKYYSENAKKSTSDKLTSDLWKTMSGDIYKHNPLYSMNVKASSGKEAYLLFRRKEIAGLFKNKEERLADIMKYADIATDLGVYDFAAQLYWTVATFDKNNTKSGLNRFLYCLDKLGAKELKKNFNGDFDKIFTAIDKEREDEMMNSVIFKAFNN